MDPRLFSSAIFMTLLLFINNSLGEKFSGPKVLKIVNQTECTARVLAGDYTYKWIDLSPLRGKQLEIDDKDEKVWNGEIYKLSVCQQTNYTKYGQCLNQMFVYENSAKNICSNLGNESTLRMDGGEIFLRIKSQTHSLTDIKLNCSSDEGRLVCVDKLGCSSKLPGPNSFILNTKYACLGEVPKERATLPPSPKGRSWLKLSPGSIVLITTASVFVTYMIVGMAHGIGKGEKGLDRLPNSDFWRELPILVKDGVVFAFGCKLPINGGYALIKEAPPPPPAHV